MKKPLWVSILLCTGSVHAQFVINTGVPIVNSAMAVVNGDWDNQNASFTNNGLITLSGNWTSTGGYNPSGTGGLTLSNLFPHRFRPSRSAVWGLSKKGREWPPKGDSIKVNRDPAHACRDRGVTTG